MNKFSKKNIFVLITFLLFSSCQIQGNKGTAKQEGEVIELKGQVRTDLKRICDAIRLKTGFINNSNDREISAQFNVRKRDCGDTQDFDLGNFSADVRVVANQPPYLEPTTARSRYFNDIITTDGDGDIALFCGTLSNSEATNRIILSELILHLTVVMDGRYDKYIVKRTYPNHPIAGYYEIEEGTVHTSRTDSNEDMQGVLKQRVFKKPCPIGGEEYLMQNFLNLL